MSWLEWKPGAPQYAEVTHAESEAVPALALTQQIGGDHYRQCAIQPVQFIEANGLGFCEGNIIKYVTRHAAKGGAADLRKARHYIDLLLELRYPEDTE